MDSRPAFGVYIHIPYCLQRCTYCDFATYEQSKIFGSSIYVDLVLEELSQRADFYGPRFLDTIYFGGGTPSLLPAEEIVSLLKGLEKHGYRRSDKTEVTIEINPATVSQDKLSAYLDAGINRFSVGAQTFDDGLLKMVHREHNSRQTLETLDLLQKRDLNFSFDLLFALPTQTLDGVRRDLEIAIDRGSKHISPYCLTVPSGHPLSKGRAPDEEQAEMFELIRDALVSRGFSPYEISNFSLPGHESRHNLLYWTDEEYWGVGLSAHSYSKREVWGTRFWNPSSIGDYRKLIEAHRGRRFQSPRQALSADLSEQLEMHQSLTDFCHTSLRLMRGLKEAELLAKFPSRLTSPVKTRLDRLVKRGLLQVIPDGWSLTREGVVLSNLVFSEMTFLKDELTASPR
ncbi:MAG: radical SAM family heme chaperone HemW [Bdellovibrionaceae bacterium]|nr:radical SAM family heme chaperone HemW [Pseudobdellovibrionaceae bacterium]MBX3033617.1 radical SAM family heme chaperone HemW [Pseudobdellovibrionaceae bacterium]